MYTRIIQNVLWLLIIFVSTASSYRLDLWNDGPIVKGGNITFTVVVYDGNNNVASGKFQYEWEDNGIPQHSREIHADVAEDIWTVSYNSTLYPQGPYNTQVIVSKCLLSLICYEIGSQRTSFNITEILNGDMALIQRNHTRPTVFVSSADTVVHNISLKQSDYDVLMQAPTINTYWFVDCVYYGFTHTLNFPFNYTEPEVEHQVEALIMADFTPLPPPTTTPLPTTTTTPTTTTSTSTTTTTSTVTPPTPRNITTHPTVEPTAGSTTASNSSSNTKSSTMAPGTSTRKNNKDSSVHYNSDNGQHSSSSADSSTKSKSVVKRSTADNNKKTENGTLKSGEVHKNESRIMVKVNSTLVPYEGIFPYVCNGSKVAVDPKKTYGYFSKTVKVRAPITKVNVTGNNWLQHGDLLTLNVKCQASNTLKYCVNYEKGAYNVSGNEVCRSNYHELDKCEFTIQRYLIESTEHTVVIIIENEVSKKVTPVAVTVYKVKRQAQLSVVVVPVVFSLVATVLIIFGVAYYIQHRSRFVVEVADFNFGQNYSDMEYKTFRERLRDSIANAFFTRGPSPGSSEVPVWPPGGRKYGSMTS